MDSFRSREEQGGEGELLRKDGRRTEAMMMGVEKEADCLSELRTLCLNQTHLAHFWTSLCG